MKTWHRRASNLKSHRGAAETASAAAHAATIDPELEVRLRRMRLHLEAPDQDTLIVKRVPASPRSYSKPRTNLLIKRCGAADRCFVCVDENLEYVGLDPTLAAAFTSGPTQQGWRILACDGSAVKSLGQALEYALGILDSNPWTPAVSAAGAPGGRLLSKWATNLTDALARCPEEATLFRGEELEQVASCVLTMQGRLPLIVGEPGVGKSNLLGGVARLLAPHGRTVLAVNAGAMMAGKLFESEREMMLASLLWEAEEAQIVLALEQAEWAADKLARGSVLIREALDRGLRLIAVTTPEKASAFASEPLGSILDITILTDLSPGDTRRVLERLRSKLSKYHGVEIDEEVEQAAVERCCELRGALPGKAVRLLDLAAARARLNRSASVAPIDIYMVASRLQEGMQ